MSWIESIKRFFIKRALTNNEKNRKIRRDFIDMEKAKNIGVLVNVSSMNVNDQKWAHKYFDNLRAKNYQVFIFEINNTKKASSIFGNSVFVSPEKINWLGLPKPVLEQQIAKQSLDILINFDLAEDNTVSHLLCSYSPAKTRVGLFKEGYEGCYEIMVNTTSNKQLEKFSHEVEHYLKMLEK